MIPCALTQARRVLREALAPAGPPPACPDAPWASRRVTLSRTCYVVPVNGTTHHIRRDGACDCGGTRRQPCPAIPLVQTHLDGGGPKPLGRHPDTWPRSWTRVLPRCPICDCPTVSDPHLDSRAGPGWRCSLEPLHFWRVRMEPLRRYLAANPATPSYPWFDTADEERQAWLAAHYRPPRLAPTASPGGSTAIPVHRRLSPAHRSPRRPYGDDGHGQA
jgi:hypothetical protein